MANYYCTMRTNYFRVKDEVNFKRIMDSVESEDRVKVFKHEQHGQTWYGFGCYGGIYGIGRVDDDPDYEMFVAALQEVVADDDAIIIYEVGNEKLRYLIGSAHVITSKSQEFVDLRAVAYEAARTLLNNQNWTTRSEY